MREILSPLSGIRSPLRRRRGASGGGDGGGGGAPFWRFELFQNAGGNIGISRFEFRESPGGPDVSAEATVSYYNGGAVSAGSEPVANMFDGSDATSFLSLFRASNRQYLEFAFPAARNLGEIAIRGYHDIVTRSPNCLHVWKSSDGQVWEDFGWVFVYAGTLALRTHTVPDFILNGDPLGSKDRWGIASVTPWGYTQLSETVWHEGGVSRNGLITGGYSGDEQNGTIANLLDGNLTNFVQWNTDDMPRAYHHNFSSAVPLDRVDISANASYPERHLTEFSVVGYDQTTGWGVTALEVSGITWAGGETKQFNW